MLRVQFPENFTLIRFGSVFDVLPYGSREEPLSCFTKGFVKVKGESAPDLKSVLFFSWRSSLAAKERSQTYLCSPLEGVLWPVFHMVNYIPDGGESTYDEALWHVYMIVNRKFKEAIVGRFHEGVDSIWIHDYHLMLLPSMLRRDLDRCRIGFFLHTPWPSSEMYRNLPWRVQLLEGMLGSSILGFHLFDYARHFLSACVRLLDLEQKLTRGALTVEHHGRISALLKD
uniref:Trehalose-6-phosphate synthase n=1 Tax=Rhodosorus marinus TaxID=101924 RepID=A0A7S2ZXD1_9RHOD|mmetsp:Transcript_35422/g.140819  ORF Transcript_35422/g.140819 Transcript_35422/m.140819 type:complete len:228 (+) Transcript_35422:535-1218(+)